MSATVPATDVHNPFLKFSLYFSLTTREAPLFIKVGPLISASAGMTAPARFSRPGRGFRHEITNPAGH